MSNRARLGIKDVHAISFVTNQPATILDVTGERLHRRAMQCAACACEVLPLIALRIVEIESTLCANDQWWCADRTIEDGGRVVVAQPVAECPVFDQRAIGEVP